MHTSLSLSELTYNMNRRRIIFIAFSLIWMVIIFMFSSETAEESSELSDGMCFKLCSFFIEDFEAMSEEEQIECIGKYTYPLRKGAHMSEYFLLALLLAGVFLPVKKGDDGICIFNKKKGYILSFIITGLYACSDEYHQLFVPGRAGRITDVLIDSAGAIIGLLLLYFILNKKYKKTSV